MPTPNPPRRARHRLAERRLSVGAALLALIIGLPALAEPTDYSKIPGYVDSSTFVDLAGGEDAIRVQVTIPPSILRIVTAGMAEEMGEAIKGIHALHAVIVALDGGSAKTEARDVIRSMRKRLEKNGWQQLALIKEEDAEVHVLILEGGEVIRGLLVLVMDADEGRLVFANIAGELDLEAIAQLGEQLDFPGLQDLDDLGSAKE